MTSTRFIAAEPRDLKPCVGTSSFHLEEKITGVVWFGFCLWFVSGLGVFARSVSRGLGPGVVSGKSAEGCVPCPGLAGGTPALAGVLRGQLRGVAGRRPLPLSCGPAPSSLKWRRTPRPSKAASSAWPHAAAQGLWGDQAQVGAVARPEGGWVPRWEPAPLAGLLGPHSALRGDGASPILAVLLRPVPSASSTDRLRVGDPRRSLLCGNRGETQRGGAAPSPPGPRARLFRRHGRSSRGLAPGWSLGAFLGITGVTAEKSQGRMCLDFRAILGRNHRKRASE